MDVLRGDGVTVGVDERGGRLASVVVEGLELLVGAEPGTEPDPLSWGCYPMVPFAGRIRHGRFTFAGHDYHVRLDPPHGVGAHAIHGTGVHRTWVRTDDRRWSTDLGPDWPWPGRVHHDVDLAGDGLTLRLTVEADEPMPVSAGWHPWFRRRLGRGTPAEIDLPAARMWHRDAEGIPDGTLVDPPDGPWDDCFTDLAGRVTLTWPGALVLRIESTCHHVVVYDEPADALCAEPQSAPPDAHNSGVDLVVVQPGHPWTIATTWRWRTA